MPEESRRIEKRLADAQDGHNAPRENEGRFSSDEIEEEATIDFKCRECNRVQNSRWENPQHKDKRKTVKGEVMSVCVSCVPITKEGE